LGGEENYELRGNNGEDSEKLEEEFVFVGGYFDGWCNFLLVAEDFFVKIF
jgi:hypothetical protein